LDYNLWTASGGANVQQRSTGSHSPTATLIGDLSQSEFSVIEVDNVYDIASSLESANEYVVIDGEYARVIDYDTDDNTLTVARGVLDTVPKSHPDGSTIFLGGNNVG